MVNVGGTIGSKKMDNEALQLPSACNSSVSDNTDRAGDIIATHRTASHHNSHNDFKLLVKQSFPQKMWGNINSVNADTVFAQLYIHTYIFLEFFYRNLWNSETMEQQWPQYLQSLQPRHSQHFTRTTKVTKKF